MAGEFDVTFDFEETMAVREGLRAQEAVPRDTPASWLSSLKTSGDYIAMQHLLVVTHGEKTHVVKHWRQGLAVPKGDQGYDFTGDNVWEPKTFGLVKLEGAWMQSVYQVDDSPRYWGVGHVGPP